MATTSHSVAGNADDVTLPPDVAVCVEGVSKKFCKHLRRSMAYGILDLTKNLLGVRPDSTSLRGGEFWAVQDVSFELRRGEVLGIIGENGSGKTTLLRLLAGILPPDRGEIVSRGRVGVLVALGAGFHPHMTGRENIYLNATILGMRRKEIDEKYDQIVEFANIGDFIDAPTGTYSSGMRVRLGFAIATQFDPEILIIDEVLAVADEAFRRVSQDRIRTESEAGQSVIIVSHNMAAIRHLCSRALFMRDGRIIASGPADDVVGQYLSGNQERRGERIWQDLAGAPGNDIVRLTAVRTRDKTGRPTNSFDVRDPVEVEMEYVVLKERYPLRAAFYFYDDAENLRFCSFDSADSPWADCPRPVGLYRAVCHVPGDFLNDGAHLVLAAIASRPGGLHAREQCALTFQIVDAVDPGGVRGNLTVRWPDAMVRPRLEWDIERLTTTVPDAAADQELEDGDA
jgi:lipopolysaccharide transport system ATP-binding protein